MKSILKINPSLLSSHVLILQEWRGGALQRARLQLRWCRPPNISSSSTNSSPTLKSKALATNKATTSTLKPSRRTKCTRFQIQIQLYFVLNNNKEVDIIKELDNGHGQYQNNGHPQILAPPSQTSPWQPIRLEPLRYQLHVWTTYQVVGCYQ